MTEQNTYLLQISSGRGPAECQLAVHKLVESILKEAAKQSLQGELVSANDGEKRGTYLSALLSVSGENAKSFCQQWRGSVKWICQSPFRPRHKRRNWFVAVELVSPADTTDSRIREKDVVFETFGASGPGGQHTNKTDSAVRARHLPSGQVVVVKSERSQLANKRLALTLLENKIEKRNDAAKKDNAQNQWQQHEQLQRGNPVKVFTGQEFREKQTNV